MDRLAGKCCIVTGAGSGIGRASARRFALEGAKVLAVDINADGLAETLKAAVGEIRSLVVDVSTEAGVQTYIDACIGQFGGLDVIYANAGISGGAVPLLDQTEAMWQNILQVNLIGPFLAVKLGGSYMASQGQGSIICTASVAGLRANAGGMPYSASKAGVVSLVQTASNAFAGTGVRVNAICPGLIETGMTRPTFERARERGTEERIGQLNPTRRYGIPDEIANMALFLASDEASYVNGQAIAVDGGLSSTHPFVPARK